MARNKKTKIKYEQVGEITRIFKRGDVWWVNYQHDGQKRRTLRTRSKKQARLKALRLERDILTGNIASDRRPPLIRDVVAQFREWKIAEGLAPKTLKKYDVCFAHLFAVADQLHASRISQITPALMNRFRKRRVEYLSLRPGRNGQKTAANDLVTIREVVNFALDSKLIRDDPLEKYKIKKVKTKPQPYWVQEELDQILAIAGRQPHHDVFSLLAYSGMRIGEVENLLWTDIDFDNRSIHIQAKSDWKPKTGDARTVPMSNQVFELLERQTRRCRWVFTFPAKGRLPDRQIRERRLLQYLKRCLKKLGLPGHVHTFRHTFISLALTRGVDEATVRNWVGHVDKETMKRYTHIANRDSHAKMLRLEQSIQKHRRAS